MTDATRYALLQRYGLTRSDLEELEIARRVLAKLTTKIIAATGTDVVRTVDAIQDVLSGACVDRTNA